MTPVRGRNQGGFVGGGDGILFGLLILIAGSLAVLNIWSIIDTRAALDAAAREYMRSYTEASTPQEASSAGERAALEVLLRRGTPLSGVRITAPDTGRFGPCEPATVTLEAEAPASAPPVPRRPGCPPDPGVTPRDRRPTQGDDQWPEP
ncbi:MAG: hypothetical protein V9E94_17910 [Microthrixaceae bacterium]